MFPEWVPRTQANWQIALVLLFKFIKDRSESATSLSGPEPSKPHPQSVF